MSDLIERLEESTQWDDSPSSLIHEAIAHIAALEAQLAGVRAVADILTRNITENGLGTHRMKINGEWHEGPVVDTCRDLLVAVRQSILSALEATPPVPKVTECATEGCAQTATVRFERGGVGSDYCHGCYMRIQTLTAAQEAGKP